MTFQNKTLIAVYQPDMLNNSICAGYCHQNQILASQLRPEQWLMADKPSVLLDDIGWIQIKYIFDHSYTRAYEHVCI